MGNNRLYSPPPNYLKIWDFNRYLKRRWIKIALDDKVRESDTAIMVDSTTPQTDEMRDITYIMDDPNKNAHLGGRRPVIFKIPLYLIPDKKGMQDLKENSIEDIDAFKRENNIPKFTTSQPSPPDFSKLYDTIRSYGFSKAIGMFLSDGLTATNNVAITVAQTKEYRDMRLELVDTKAGSGELTLAVGQMLRHTQEGIDKMVEVGRRVAEKTRLYFSVDGLEGLHNSGRLPGAKMLLASLLKIKPIISVGKDKSEDNTYGKMYVIEKIPGSNIARTLPRLVEYAQMAIANYKSSRGLACVVNIRMDELAGKLYSRLAELPMFNGNIILAVEHSNLMYTLVGPAVGVAALPVDF